MSTQAPTKIVLPELCLVLLVGASGSGKSTFARRHFRPTEVVSSDTMRAVVSDDENDLTATPAAFELVHQVVRARLAHGKLVVVDATNVLASARKTLVELAKRHYVHVAAIVFDLDDDVIIGRTRARADRRIPDRAVLGHISDLRRSIRKLQDEGIRHVHVLRTQEAVDGVTVVRERLRVDRRDVTGPFDVVGDVHGCFDELVALLGDLGWSVRKDVSDVSDVSSDVSTGRWTASHPDGRRLVFVGDLVDRGPKSADVLDLVMDLVADGTAFCVAGNHEAKLERHLRGRPVKNTHGFDATLASMEGRSEAWLERVRGFLDFLPSHYVLDGGRLVVAHAGLKQSMHGRATGAVRGFALYGDTTGEIDEFGLPVRLDWAQEYRGKAMVVHGHVPVVEARAVNNTLDVDTGCCFGGKLTALRYPEGRLVAVKAAKVYYEPIRPLGGMPSASAEQLDLQDVVGRRFVETRLAGKVLVREENAAAALEAMSRWAVDPRWLVYLPPTMSPVETSQREGFLEHPEDAFAYYRNQGVPVVVCEEKHMGSRAVAVVCRDEKAARERFGVAHDGGAGDVAGVVYTRTGRRFFEDAAHERAILDRFRRGMDKAGLWTSLQTDWAVIDCEILPWSAKAQVLLRDQYAPVGTAGRAALGGATRALEQAMARGVDVAAVHAKFVGREPMLARYQQAWRGYVWDVAGPDDLVVAPFHLLATEGRVHVDKDHRWHMETLASMDVDGLRKTRWRAVPVNDDGAVAEAIAWWEQLVGGGGEGMVVKPLDYVARGKKGWVQPAVKVRGPEYLRIIYGPEYTAHLDRLKARALGPKRALALRELALGIEALERFVKRESLRRVHEPVFAVLAMESEPVDPRL